MHQMESRYMRLSSFLGWLNQAMAMWTKMRKIPFLRCFG
jgi:hypothetical protein